jgi:gluconate 5-dehydrogenase
MSTEAGARANALDLFRLDGKTAVVTGGGRGLGQYMAEALSDAGARVVLCSRKKEALEEVKRRSRLPATSRIPRTCTGRSPRPKKPSGS